MRPTANGSWDSVKLRREGVSIGTMGNHRETFSAGGLPAVAALEGGTTSKDTRGPTGQEGRENPL